MVGGKTNQMALSCNRNLQSLPDPPSCISCKSGTMAHIKSIDSLHQSTNSFLKQIGITKSMVPKALGNVRSKANISRSEPMFKMYIAIMKPSDCSSTANRFNTVIFDKLCHRPRFERWPLAAKFWVLSNQGTN